jgi:hypothetical protein
MVSLSTIRATQIPFLTAWLEILEKFGSISEPDEHKSQAADEWPGSPTIPS